MNELAKELTDPLIKLVKDRNNSHVLHFWDELNEGERENLLDELRKIDFPQIEHYYEQFISATSDGEPETGQIEPASFLSQSALKKGEEFRTLGEEALKSGKVAFLTVAGGQATRLGYDYPKGCYPISPFSKMSLFKIFAEKIKFYSELYGVDMKWYIMTSQSNHSYTKEYFRKNSYFGLKKERVVFFSQAMLPTLTLEGRLILKGKNSLFLNPDGHGGILSALLNQNLLSSMKAEGIEHLSYFQVDNPLINMADPYFIGYHIKRESQVTTKVIAKNGPNEKLGNIVKVNGVNRIIEYSDISPELSEQRTDEGGLRFSMGSIGIHIFSTDCLEKFTRKLPVHFARKKIKAYNFKEDTPTIEELDVVKFERFVFDIIPLVERTEFFETVREEEFFPLKNKSGSDSIETCIQGQIDLYKSWLKEAGFEVDDCSTVEISPLFAPDRHIFLQKAATNTDILKEYIFNEDGSIKNEIYIK